uniref:Uncharacterized protein n=1 Tax=candidate division WOR-3 bacterium TaxID=2052148 RepID=A0A7C4CAI3_UNCW3
MLLTGLACRRPNTVYGTVAVAPGVDEAVDGAVVAIYTRPDSLRIPYRTVRVVPAAPLAHRAHFRIGNLPLGDYWLRAWRDSNGDETLSDGDLAGILGGGSSRDSAGRAFWLGEGWVYDVGEIELERFEELVVGVSGRRYAGDTLTRFEYRFNHDVVLSSLAIRFPFYGEYPDGNAPGCKLADTVYTSPGWRFNGAVMPTDTHRLTFRGTRAGDTFRITVVVCVE